MADEIKLNVRLTCSNGEFDVTHSKNITADQTTQGHSQVIQVIGTGSHELLVINSDIGTAGKAWIQNLDSANYVEIGNDVTGTFSPLLKIPAGGVNVIDLSHKNLYAKANTSSVRLLVSVLEA